ncbi:MAG: response regulator [Planctomycetota bacterium]|jgi:two-component system OmpR family response regulator
MAKIMVIDDEEGVRYLLASLFSLDGHTACFPDPIQDAPAILPYTEPDLALLDINLGVDSNGVELAWKLHTLRTDLPIVFMSGQLEEWELDDLIDCGGCAFLPKPFTIYEVRSVIDRLTIPIPA